MMKTYIPHSLVTWLPPQILMHWRNKILKYSNWTEMKRGNMVHCIQLHNKCLQSPQTPLNLLQISFSMDDLVTDTHTHTYTQHKHYTHISTKNAVEPHTENDTLIS